MEIEPGIHRVEAPLGERYVSLYIIVGDTCAMLVDTGVEESITGSLLPYLRGIGYDPAQIRYVVNTHSDFDHVGGNAAIRAASPRAVLMCGERDRPMVEDLELMIDGRYGEFRDDHGFDDTDETKVFIRKVTGVTPVDVGLAGGETFDLGGRRVTVLHTPGHSWGHLSVYDEQSRAVFIGDAVLSNTVPFADGRPAFPPTYRDVDPYRSTIRHLSALAPNYVLTAHYPVYEGTAARDFLDGSLAYTDLVESVVLDTVQASADAVTLLDIVHRSRERLGSWDPVAADYLVYPILGHLEVLERYRAVRRQPAGSGGVVTWVASS